MTPVGVIVDRPFIVPSSLSLPPQLGHVDGFQFEFPLHSDIHISPNTIVGMTVGSMSLPV
jgi:hypothetical protein